jgi:hypothetical protein
MDVAFNPCQEIRVLKASFLHRFLAVRRHPWSVQPCQKGDGIPRPANQKLLLLELHDR